MKVPEIEKLDWRRYRGGFRCNVFRVYWDSTVPGWTLMEDLLNGPIGTIHGFRSASFAKRFVEYELGLMRHRQLASGLAALEWETKHGGNKMPVVFCSRPLNSPGN